MKDIVGQLYNGFFLRDLLGYVVPGVFVLLCFIHLLSVIIDVTIIEVFQLIPDSNLVYFFIVCLCYIFGHFLSGIFFHTSIFRWMFKYSPDLSKDYPNMTADEAWSAHRALVKKSSATIGDSMQSHVERHAALLHFTGHVSASFLFVVIYLGVYAIYSSSYEMLSYTIPIFILFPGVYIHYKRLSIERYHLERASVNATKDKGKIIVKDNND